MAEEKRIVSGYEITQSIHIGDQEVLFGISLTNDNPAEKYMCTYATRNQLFEQYENTVVGDDYLELMEIYTQRVSEQINKEKGKHTNPAQVITADMCYPSDYCENIQGKIVAIKPSILRDEYQRSEHQLMLVTGGFGSHANAHGTACFCTNIYTGEKTRYERHDILGEIQNKHIPDWAYEKLPNILIDIPDWSLSKYSTDKVDKHAIIIDVCTKFIKQNVLQGDMLHPIAKDSIKELVKTFGTEIPLEVVGNALSQHKGDGRIDKAVLNHASSYADCIKDKNECGISEVAHAGVIELMYKGLMREERDYYAKQDFVFNGNTRFKVIDSCDEATLLQRFTNHKTVSDPTPYITAIGLSHKGNCSVEWDFGTYHDTLEDARKFFETHFNNDEKLAKKVDREHRAYIDETLKLSPKEIFDRSYQTTMYADISMIFEEEDLVSLDIVTPLLLKSDNVLSNIYDEWLSNGYSHMEDVRETIHDYSNKVVKRNNVKATTNSRVDNDIDLERD